MARFIESQSSSILSPAEPFLGRLQLLLMAIWAVIGPSGVGDRPERAIGRRTSDVARPDEPRNRERQYTAVVYFHGMGSQRRYEELSRLVHALDIYDHLRPEDPGWGRLRFIRAVLEARRSGSG